MENNQSTIAVKPTCVYVVRNWIQDNKRERVAHFEVLTVPILHIHIIL